MHKFNKFLKIGLRVFPLQVLLLLLFFFSSGRTFGQFGANTCMGATTIKLNLTGGTLHSGTAGTVGVKYKYANCNVGGTIGIDVTAELVDIQYGTQYSNSVFSFDPDNAGGPTTGVENNFQPTFNGIVTTKTFPAGTNENLSSTWKFEMFQTGTSTRVYSPVVAQVIDNDGAPGGTTSATIRESVIAITTPTSITLANPTTQNLAGNTITGPTTNQSGIGFGTEYIAYYYFNNVNSFTFRFNHNLVVGTAYTATNAAQPSRRSSAHLGCDYTGNVNFVLTAISGTIFNDVDGVNGTPSNTVNGIGTNVGGQLFATLYDNSNGYAFITVPVAANGTYSFNGITPGNNYSVYIGNVNTPIGQTAVPTTTLPTGWVNTSEFFGTGAGNDGSSNGILNLGVVNANTTNVNFGIQQSPTAGNGSNNALNPNGTIQITVPTNTFTNGANSTDPVTNTVTAIRIVSFPTGALSIVINGTSYTSATFPGAGVTVPTDASGNPTQTITVDPLVDGITIVSIPFRAVDAAGTLSSNIGNAVLNIIGVLPVSLVSFSAIANDNSVRLQWKTSSETNSAGFYLEHSIDGIIFNRINFTGSKSVNSNSTSQLEYGITHYIPANGINYYRLLSVDKVGNVRYSSIERATINNKQILISVVPNPVTADSKLMISGINKMEKAVVTIISAQGQVMSKTTVMQSVTFLQSDKLPAGLYIVKYTDENGNDMTTRFVK